MPLRPVFNSAIAGARARRTIVYIDEAEAQASEANRDKGERGQSVDRTWQMWVEDAMGPQK